MNLVKNFALPFSFSPSTRLSHNMSPPPAGPIYSFLQTLPLPSLPYSVQRWIPGQSPFSTHTEVFAALAAYLAIIFGGQFIMKGSKPYRKYTLSSLRGEGREEEGRFGVGGTCSRKHALPRFRGLGSKRRMEEKILQAGRTSYMRVYRVQTVVSLARGARHSFSTTLFLPLLGRSD